MLWMEAYCASSVADSKEGKSWLPPRCCLQSPSPNLMRKLKQTMRSNLCRLWYYESNQRSQFSQPPNPFKPEKVMKNFIPFLRKLKTTEFSPRFCPFATRFFLNSSRWLQRFRFWESISQCAGPKEKESSLCAQCLYSSLTSENEVYS